VSAVHVVILAAGKGTRMKSSVPKVLHRIGGRPLIEYVLSAARTLNPQTTAVVVGHGADQVRAALVQHRDLTFVVQEPQLGTAHALQVTEPVLRHAQGALVLLSGDVPHLKAETLRQLVDRHLQTGATATVLTALVDNPHGYGRIVRVGDRIARIVEERDATPAERAIREINAGIYVFALDGLFDVLREVAAENAQGEYYLPDIVQLFGRRGRVVGTMDLADRNEILGVNSRGDLATSKRLLRARKNAQLMADGVTLEDPETTYIDDTVQIGADTVIYPGVFLEGRTVVGSGCVIHSGVRVVDSTIGDRTQLFNHSVITNVTIGSDASIGPFAHVHKASVIGSNTKVGNFVEAKNTKFGNGSKAAHLSYLGDGVIGSKVNIGAGTITCNYDGVQKSQTTIEDGAFIGSDTQLIAPVTVGRDAYVGTGTTIREDVPAGALAVSAGKQRNIEGWVEQRRRKSAERKTR
jgi:bifunctional UDP-N-acetylglucosamine pyrophosphorylase/glucosamine-1-phosphate N-acetyltransferase